MNDTLPMQGQSVTNKPKRVFYYEWNNKPFNE
jgi:hypothetical protein